MKRNDSNGWKRGEGVYSSSKDLKLNRPEDSGSGPKINRTRTIEDNSEVNGGFAGPLTAPK